MGWRDPKRHSLESLRGFCRAVAARLKLGSLAWPFRPFFWVSPEKSFPIYMCRVQGVHSNVLHATPLHTPHSKMQVCALNGWQQLRPFFRYINATELLVLLSAIAALLIALTNQLRQTQLLPKASTTVYNCYARPVMIASDYFLRSWSFFENSMFVVSKQVQFLFGPIHSGSDNKYK